MQKVACPGCGAPVEFRSAASVMAVCGFCRSTLLKDAESVKDVGKMSAVLEDYSPIRVTTSGSHHGRRFSVVGRIQLRYEDGFWNEWYVLFDDGTGAWLSDASGQFAVTMSRGPQPSAPAFQSIVPGAVLALADQPFRATDVRTARCTGGEGELPFRVGDGYEARVVDFRKGASFATLDFSDPGPPVLYLGEAVELADLDCQLLRSDEDVAASAGRYRGRTVALDCPNCGGALKYQAGMAFHVLCPSCHAEVDCAQDTAQVLRKHEELAAVRTTLALGDGATIDGVRYELVGLMQCAVSSQPDAESWFEYLLFEPKRGFLWLVEMAGSWERVAVLSQWPDVLSPSSVRWNGEAWRKSDEYDSVVRFAAGSFNWRVSIGDTTAVADYVSGTRKLTSERSAHEIGWSTSVPVESARVFEWFGRAGPVVRPSGAAAPASAPQASGHAFAARIASIVTLVLNVPLSFASGMRGLVVIVVALSLLWLPVLISSRASESE